MAHHAQGWWKLVFGRVGSSVSDDVFVVGHRIHVVEGFANPYPVVVGRSARRSLERGTRPET